MKKLLKLFFSVACVKSSYHTFDIKVKPIAQSARLRLHSKKRDMLF